MVFPFPELFKFQNLWTMVHEMIRVSIEGTREFWSVGVSVVLTSSAEMTRIVILVLITRVAPSVISLGARRSSVHVLSMSVTWIADFVFTYIFRRRWIRII